MMVALTLAAALAVMPAGAAAKPRYSVSLRGDVRNDVTTVRDALVTPPEGCAGSMSETSRFVASAGLTPKGGAAAPASYGRLRFRARLTSPSAASTTETAGSFAVDPTFPPDDPATCAVAPSRKSLPCEFSAEATRTSGAEFVLLPNKDRYELYYNRNRAIVSCDDEIRESLLDVAHPKLTTLRVRAVKRLARGRSVSVSGTASTSPADPEATGGETLHYTLVVKRAR